MVRILKTQIMKQIIFYSALLLGSFMTSCAKEYTCDCVDPETSETNQMVFLTNQKAHATRLCDDWQSRTRTTIPTKSKVTCTIK